MKNSLTIVLFLLIIFSQTKAQDGFVVKASGPNLLNIPEDLAIKPDDNVFFMFCSVPSSPSYTYTNEIIELNPSGEIINSYVFTDSVNTAVEYTHCLIVDDTLYVFGWGYQVPEVNIYRTFLLMHKFDLQLNLISMHQNWLLELYPYGVSHGQLKYFNGDFYYVNGYGDNITQIPFVVKVSKQGEIINFASEGFVGYQLFPYDFTINEADGGFQVFSCALYFPGFPSYSGVIGNYNSNFEIKNYHLLPYNFMNFYTYQVASDSTFYLSGQWMNWNSSSFWRAGVLKMKNDTTVLNELIYSTYPDSAACPAYRNSIEVLSDGNLIFCFNGDLLVQMFPQLQPAKINLMKLSPDLEVIWHRYIGEPDSKFDAYSMHTNSNDEIVILGAYSPAPWSNFDDMQALFIKTDSDGLITNTDEDLHGVRSTEAVIYPNPARDFVHVEFSMAYANATFVLLDINGNPVLEKRLMTNRENLDLTGVLPGSYVYRIYNQKGLDERGKLVVGR